MDCNQIIGSSLGSCDDAERRSSFYAWQRRDDDDDENSALDGGGDCVNACDAPDGQRRARKLQLSARTSTILQRIEFSLTFAFI